MRWLLLLAVAVLAAGCGGGGQKTADEKIRAQMAKVQTTCAPGVNCAADKTRPFRKCTSVSRGFRACSTFLTRDRHTAIYRRGSEGWRKVIGPLPHRLGWWSRVLPSSDRRTLLVQWSGECEVQSTYLVSAATGKERPILNHQESHALGWSMQGQARVAVPNTSYYSTDGGRPRRAGIYLVDPQTLAVRLQRRLPDRHGC